MNDQIKPRLAEIKADLMRKLETFITQNIGPLYMETVRMVDEGLVTQDELHMWADEIFAHAEETMQRFEQEQEIARSADPLGAFAD